MGRTPNLHRKMTDLVAKVRSIVVADKHPKTAAALYGLELAIKSEFKFKFHKGVQPLKTWHNKVASLNNKVKALEKQVQTYQSTKPQRAA